MIRKELLQKIRHLNFPILAESDIHNLENKLNILFSKEFYEISKLANFEYFSAFNIYNLNLETQYSVIGETIRLRENCNLPKDTLLLSEEDSSVLLMKCLATHEEIYWITMEDFFNYCAYKPFLQKSIIFRNFYEFFEYLIKEQDKS